MRGNYYTSLLSILRIARSLQFFDRPTASAKYTCPMAHLYGNPTQVDAQLLNCVSPCSPKSTEDSRDLKQTDAAAANPQISIQKDSRPSEFTRPLTSITLNLNGDLRIDRRRVSLLKFPGSNTTRPGNAVMKRRRSFTKFLLK